MFIGNFVASAFRHTIDFGDCNEGNLSTNDCSHETAVETIMPEAWSKYGASLARPNLGAGVLAVQLCQWKRCDYDTVCKDLAIAKSA